jgi:hypothetical protein
VKDCALVCAKNRDPCYGKPILSVLSWIEKRDTKCFPGFSSREQGTGKECHFQSAQCLASKASSNPVLQSRKTKFGVLCDMCVAAACNKKECDRIVKLCQRIDMVDVLETMQQSTTDVLTALSVKLMQRSYSGPDDAWWMQDDSGCSYGYATLQPREVAKWWLSLPMVELHGHVLVPSELDRDCRLLPTAYCILLSSA